MHLYYFMEGTNMKITMFAHFQEYHRNRKLFRMFLIVCKLNSLDITDNLPALVNLLFTFLRQ